MPASPHATAHRPIAVSKKVYARPSMLKSPRASYHRHKRLHTKNADSVKTAGIACTGRRLEARIHRSGAEEGFIAIEWTPRNGKNPQHSPARDCDTRGYQLLFSSCGTGALLEVPYRTPPSGTTRQGRRANHIARRPCCLWAKAPRGCPQPVRSTRCERGGEGSNRSAKYCVS